jgi:hypothetical protein
MTDTDTPDTDGYDGWALLDDVLAAAADLTALVDDGYTPCQLQDATRRLHDAVTLWRETLEANLPPRLQHLRLVGDAEEW